MKILYVLKTNTGAGWAFRQANWIVNNYPGIKFVVCMPSDTGGFADKYRDIGAEVIGIDMSLPYKNPFSFFKLRKKIRKIIDDTEPDIVHSHFVTTTFMLRLSLQKDIPLLFQVPGPLHLENKLTSFADKITLRGRDYLVATCKWTYDKYLSLHVKKDHVFLNYYGGAMTRCGRPENFGILTSEFNQLKEKVLVGMVSYYYAPKKYLFKFRGIKGHEDFIDAIKIVREKNPNIVGVIIGAAWDKKARKYEYKVHKYAQKVCPDGIFFTGYRNDVMKIYTEFSVAVHPSHSENLGGAGESLALAIPTVATEVGGFPDIVIDGVTGFLVKKNNPKSLADGISRVLNNLDASNALALEGQRRCKELLSLDLTGKNMVQIYRTIIKNRSL